MDEKALWLAYLETNAIQSEIEKFINVEFIDTLDASNSFDNAFECLQTCDSSFIQEQVIKIVPIRSYKHMKSLLSLGIEECTHVDTSQEMRKRLDKYIYRLETYRLLLIATESDENEYDGRGYIEFREASLPEVALDFARNGQISMLTILFQRNGMNLLPQRLNILTAVPPWINIDTYLHLLPVLHTEANGIDAIESIREGITMKELLEKSEIDSSIVATFDFTKDNKDMDLLESEDAAFKDYTHNITTGDINGSYIEWYKKQIFMLDSEFGLLDTANTIGQFVKWNIKHQTNNTRMDELLPLIAATSRLSVCVYELSLNCSLTLTTWINMSLEEQLMTVLGASSSPPFESLDVSISAVFLQSRIADYEYDDAFVNICRSLISTHQTDPFHALSLCTQIVYNSNSSIIHTMRWIQSDLKLLEAATEAMLTYSINSATDFKRFSSNVEQLWIIFQSLPIRKENDSEKLVQLQVLVDEIEDLMVSVDVLLKYNIHYLPSTLKLQLQNNADDISFPKAIVGKMCDFMFSHNLSEEDEVLRRNFNGDDEANWTCVWGHAMKLKELLFGEKLPNNTILDLILQSLLQFKDIENLVHEKSIAQSCNAIQELVLHWISSNPDIIPHVLELLNTKIQEVGEETLDITYDSATKAADIDGNNNVGVMWRLVDVCKGVMEFAQDNALRLLSNDSIARIEVFREQLSIEMDILRACELFKLLTKAQTSLSPNTVRAASEENDRLEIIFQVLGSHESGYCTPSEAKEWLQRQRMRGNEFTQNGNMNDGHVMAGVMFLADLLRVKHRSFSILVKGATAALISHDYSTAYDLLLEAVTATSIDPDQDVASISLSVLSPTLDLVSAQNFEDWSKKINLIQEILSLKEPSSSILYNNPIVELLLERLTRLQAIKGLAVELGLSESDLRQKKRNSRSSSDERLLLTELDIVVSLLQSEEPNKLGSDRNFLRTLLQKGLRVMQLCGNPRSTEDDKVWMQNCCRKLAILAFQECLRLVEAAENGHAEYEADVPLQSHSSLLQLAFAYVQILVQLDVGEGFYNENKHHIVQEMWQQDILPLLTSQGDRSRNNSQQMLLKHFHHFFLLQMSLVAKVSPIVTVEACLNSYTSTKQENRHAVGEPALDIEIETTHAGVFESDDNVAENSDYRLNARSTSIKKMFEYLAQQCDSEIVSKRKSRELEEVASFFNDLLDLERFSNDSTYRCDMIFQLARSKERFDIATSFAQKYNIDPYECILAYIQSVLLPGKATDDQISRQEQFESAFRSENMDFLDRALARPIDFGNFLVVNKSSIYNGLSGSDYVGLLLVLRMILECSKREQQNIDESMSQSEQKKLLPLSKFSSERVTLLFMCIKRLKEATKNDAKRIDFKRICSASTPEQLLYWDPSRASNTVVSLAVEEVVPFLSGKNVKILTKIMQKTTSTTIKPSGIVMIYLNQLLKKIWIEQTEAPSTSRSDSDISNYAYESCQPFLSVLSNEHLMYFYQQFVGKRNKSEPLNIYGQELDYFHVFSSHLSHKKRYECISDTLSLFTERSNMKASDATDSAALAIEQEAKVMLIEVEDGLFECAFWLTFEAIKEDNSILKQINRKLQIPKWESELKRWFAFNLQKRMVKEVTENIISVVFIDLFICCSSLELAILLMELVFYFVNHSSQDSKLRNMVEQVYTASYKKFLSSHENFDWVNTEIYNWAIKFPVERRLVKELEYVSAHLSRQIHKDNTTDSFKLYMDILNIIDNSHSIAMKNFVSLQRSTQAQRMENNIETIANQIRSDLPRMSNDVLVSLEDKGEWKVCAIVSHILVSVSLNSGDLFKNIAFGYRVKGIYSWYLEQMSSMSPPHPALALEQARTVLTNIFEIPTNEIYDKFPIHVFEQLMNLSLLPGIGDQRRHGLGNNTLILALLVLEFEELSLIDHPRDVRLQHSWTEELQRSMSSRCKDILSGTMDQLSVESNTKPNEVHLPDSPSPKQQDMWSKLLLCGNWGEYKEDHDIFIQWYLDIAYERIYDDGVFVKLLLQNEDLSPSKPSILIMLLACPFDSIRYQHHHKLLTSAANAFVVRYQTQAPIVESEPSNIISLMDLVLLRFKISDLLAIEAVKSTLAYIHQNLPPHHICLWTSSLEFFVCALIANGYYAMASRLVCAITSTHPFLYDAHSSRLVLYNYLSRLQIETYTVYPKDSLQRQVIEYTVNKYQKTQVE